MAKRGWLNDRDLPGDSDKRLYFALNLKEGLTPAGVIEDWGDYNNDYPDKAHDDANAISKNRHSSGFGVSSPEEVQRYYDSGNSADIDIKILGDSQ
ncbi:hypothetical protein [Almyronema epifaneia]|uniref:Uncharacterized protein n=1 Tax=Almyronema epifaneia S1 TaxID=2991925 RepID=A0ABW6IJL5_9CYAN